MADLQRHGDSTISERTLSIIIPTWNEASQIEEALLSALDQNPIEVIVCDGHSNDDTVQIVHRIANDLPSHAASKIECVQSDLGRGSQLAEGAKFATGDFLLFLHADNRLTENVLGQLKAANWPAWGGFQQQILDPRFRFRLLERGNAVRIQLRSMVFGDQALFVERQLYQTVGGFQTISLMEDVAICKRLRQITKATLLPGPVQVDARRWQARGVIRQTLRNWLIQIGYALGASPTNLKDWYSR